MNIISVDSPLLKLIDLERLMSYLTLNGWTRCSEVYLEKNITYKSPKNLAGESISIIIPRESGYIDFYNRIADVINTLSFYYEKEAKNILQAISSCFTDVFKARILDIGTFENCLPIDEVYREIGGIRSLFLYGASSEINPARHFDSPLSKGQKFIETCRFGHTFKGSFGFTVELPLVKPNEEQDIFDLPFERKVNERIARGLNLVKVAVSNDDADILVNGYSSAFNSKMCDALLNISNQTSKPVELMFDWAKEIPLSNDVKDFDKITLQAAHYDVISYAASKLKEVPPENITIFGKIVNLHCTNNPLDESIVKSVIIKYIKEVNSKIDVKASLSAHDNKIACKAHIEGKSVNVKGKLERLSGQWTISEIKMFKIQS